MAKYQLFYRRMLDLAATQGIIEEQTEEMKAETLSDAIVEAEAIQKSLTFNGHYFLAIGIYSEQELLHQVL